MLNVFLKSIFIGFLLAIPAPFLLQWLSESAPVNLMAIQFFTVYILVFAGCLLMGVTGSRSEKEEQSSEEETGRETGTVKWFNVAKGFGFITRNSGEDIFVHYRSIRGTGRRSLSEGQRVRFIVTKGEKGLQADDVSIER